MDIESPSPEQDLDDQDPEQDHDDQDPDHLATDDQDENKEIPEGDPELDGGDVPEGEENKIEDIIAMEPEPWRNEDQQVYLQQNSLVWD